MEGDGYMKILSGYPSSVFQRFQNYLRTEIDLVEDDIRLILAECNSSFITYKLEPGIYTFKYLSEALFKVLHPEYLGPSNVIVNEFDDFTRKIKLVVRNGIIAITFDEKSLFSTVLGFIPCWDYKHYEKYISKKNFKLK